MRIDQLRLIELDEFPFEFISQLAEQESWRKEIHRPIYHIHKWWAKRLGSVFRGILLGAALPPDAKLKTEFYKIHDLFKLSVLDPFMGSGVTIGEAHKLGLTAFGRDINPVACEAVRVALGKLDATKLKAAFSRLDSTIGDEIREIYSCKTPSGAPCDVLYYFWVKTLPCPDCSKNVDLFSSYVFARNAYPGRKPEVKVLCPCCGGILAAKITDELVTCGECSHCFDPNSGPVNRTIAKCNHCRNNFPIAKVAKRMGMPPSHRLYAKLVLRDGKEKIYLPATDSDQTAYAECTRRLSELTLPIPDLPIETGNNTDQALGYGYSNWKQFFNDRQLLALGLLHQAILAISDPDIRSALLTVFSGALEFNNMFASYKGEGTGAVRHMFAHHILKPERTPLEANVWGTPKSSGSFSTLFQKRLFRAIEYRQAPTEIVTAKDSSLKKCVASPPFAGRISTESQPRDLEPRAIHLSCGSSATLPFPSTSIDLVVTDPPFFDNVHYSELADFFYAWQCLSPNSFQNGSRTTRHVEEVQDAEPEAFSKKLCDVFREAKRVLRPGGLLIFSYHHSRQEGWTSVAQSIHAAGFSLINAHPVKAEMSVATPKSQAKEPIQLDIIMVCRRAEDDIRDLAQDQLAAVRSRSRATSKLERLEWSGFSLSASDRRITFQSQLLVELFPGRDRNQLAQSFLFLSDALFNHKSNVGTLVA